MRNGRPRDTGPSREVREAVRKRAQWCCERCGRSALYGDVHHRKPRKMGGTSDPAVNLPSNLVLLCQDCHRDIESNRLYAIGTGWLVSSGLDPAKIPIRTRVFGYVFLTEDGAYRVGEGELDGRDGGRSADERTGADGPGDAAAGA